MQGDKFDPDWSHFQTYLNNITIPTLSVRVFKDECILSFQSPKDKDGIYINLKTFEAYSYDYLPWDHQRTNNKVYLHYEQYLIPKEENLDGVKSKPTEMSIGTENGFKVGDNQEYSDNFSLFIYPEKISKKIDPQDSPDILSKLVLAVKSHPGNKVNEAVSSWENSLKVSRYAKDLPIVDNPPNIPPSNWKCANCNATTNLWLNLSDGYIGCGRKLYGFGGGCVTGQEGAALVHFQETGKKYPLAVKLGTITAKSGDVFSYADDEDDTVLDPYLASHLARFGINIQMLQITEQSTSELEIEQNMNFDWSRVTEEDQELEIVTGPDHVGLKNLGNSCYVNSVLQLLFTIPEFVDSVLLNSQQFIDYLPKDKSPSDDLFIQLSKLFSALKLTKPFYPGDYTNNENQESPVLDISMIKSLIGKGHQEFSTGQQQDAEEYLGHVIDRVQKAENELFSNPNFQFSYFNKFLQLVQFEVEERFGYLNKNTVKYTAVKNNILSLDIPNIEALSIEHESMQTKRQKLDNNEKDTSDTSSPSKTFQNLIDFWGSEEIREVRGTTPSTNPNQISYKTRFKSFPLYLFVQIKKFYVGSDWTPKKLNISIDVPETINLNSYKASGPQPDEVIEEESSTEGNGQNIQPDYTIVESIVELGFTEKQALNACIATKNASPEACIDWILNNPDEIINNGTSTIDEQNIQAETEQLIAMGFSHSQATVSLQKYGNDIELALNWLFNNPEEVEAAIIQKESFLNNSGTDSLSPEPYISDCNGEYQLVGFITHIGKNSSSGHYVAHIKKNNRWKIFNDHKVALSNKPPFDLGYIYLYKRV